MAWAEDRAPWRHDPSAVPGAKTEGGRQDAALSFPFGIGNKATNRHYLFERAVSLISRPRSLHFTLNHYTVTWSSMTCDWDSAASAAGASGSWNGGRRLTTGSWRPCDTRSMRVHTLM